MSVILSVLETVAIIAAVSFVVGALARGYDALTRSRLGVRYAGLRQRLQRRFYGPPKAVPVEMGPDGLWRQVRYVSPRVQWQEKWAGRALWCIAGLFAAGIAFFELTAKR